MGGGEANGVEPGMKDDTEKYGMKEFFLSILGLHRRLFTVIARRLNEYLPYRPCNGELLVYKYLLMWYVLRYSVRHLDGCKKPTPS